MKTYSIRWHIQRWHGALLVVVVTVMAVTFYFYERRSRMDHLERQLSETLTDVLPRLISPAPRRGPPRPLGLRRIRQERDPANEDEQTDLESVEEYVTKLGFYYAVWRPDGQIRSSSANIPAQLISPAVPTDQPETFLRRHDGLLEACHVTPLGSCAAVGTEVGPLQKDLQVFAIKLAGGSLVLILAGLGVGWWLVGRETDKIARIGAVAGHIANGNLSERIQIPDSSEELSKLTDVLNGAFEKLENAFNQQVRFTADASHELRTPVTVILTKGQLALTKERSPEKYRETIQTCVDAATHMRRIIESLLELARFDSGEAVLEREDSDLAVCGKEAVELLTPLAEQKEITLIDHLESAPAHIDTQRFRQVFINLISNSIKYSPPRTSIIISTTNDDGRILLAVRDQGPGLSEDDLPRLFDRFFRGSTTEAQERERTGLGLAITKAIVVAHGGAITAHNHPEGGAVFEIQLPPCNTDR